MDLVACNVCRSCNRKDRPSVLRGSAYCDSHRVKHVHGRKGLFGWISKKFFSNLKDKMYDRRIKYNEDGSIRDFKHRGFREDWFWR